MNPIQQPPDEFPDDSGDVFGSEELAQVERRLKSRQPRPANLDFDAIMRSAEQSNEVVSPINTPARGAVRRSYGWISTVVVSWMCGAIIGALVASVLMEPDIPLTDAPERLMTRTAEQPTSDDHVYEIIPVADVEARQEDEPIRGEPLLDDPEPLIAGAFFEPHGWGSSAGQTELTVLRPGSFARISGGVRARSRSETVAVQSTPMNTQDTADGVQDNRPSEPLRRPMTRAELLQELLGTSIDSLL